MMKSIQIESGFVHYRECGDGAPLILLHANPGDSRDYDAVIPELSKYFRVIAIDWPGYGKSTPPSTPESVDVLFFYRIFERLVDALDLSRVSIIGNSLGGSVAARYSALRPERVASVVLVAPGGFTSHNLLTRLFCRIQGSRFSMPPHLFARLYLRVGTASTRKMLERARSAQRTPTALAINRALWRSFGKSENDLREIARSIDIPVQLIFGAKDPAVPAKRDGAHASRAMPKARTVVLPCGHAPFAELPDAFLENVVPFLIKHRRLDEAE